MAYSAGRKTQPALWGGGMGARPAFSPKAEAVTAVTGPDFLGGRRSFVYRGESRSFNYRKRK